MGVTRNFEYKRHEVFFLSLQGRFQEHFKFGNVGVSINLMLHLL